MPLRHQDKSIMRTISTVYNNRSWIRWPRPLCHNLPKLFRAELLIVLKASMKLGSNIFVICCARMCKRKLDDQPFYGGTLHICYAPEYESTEDTRLKLQERRKDVARRLRKLQPGGNGKNCFFVSNWTYDEVTNTNNDIDFLYSAHIRPI